MTATVAIYALLAAAASCLLTGFARSLALARGMLDLPNNRSSHSAPTPRGGGIAIVTTVCLGVGGMYLQGLVAPRLAVGLLAGIGVASIGLVDDRRPVSPLIRLLVHMAAAISVLVAAGGLPPIAWGRQLIDLGLAGSVFGVLGIVWTLNLFNFMDGIDGIAASEAAFITGAGAILHLCSGGTWVIAAPALVFCAACCGFLFWNWAPAKIFMGDAGSGFLGFFVAALAVSAAREQPAAFYVWLILGGCFFVDATFTFLRRLLRGERIYEAHRSHTYQRLAMRWRSHARVTLAVNAINLLWLLPCAVLAGFRPSSAPLVTLIALTPLVAIAVLTGAGRKGS